MIKKADIILIIILMVVFIFASIFLGLKGGIGTKVNIKVGNEIFGTYDLLRDEKIVIEKDPHINEIIIKGGKVSMIKSNCQGEDCIRQGHKEKKGETIVCLPNKVLVEVLGGKEEFDSVSK